MGAADLAGAGFGIPGLSGIASGRFISAVTPAACSVPSLATEASPDGTAVASRSNIVKSLALRTLALAVTNQQRSSAGGRGWTAIHFGDLCGYLGSQLAHTDEIFHKLLI